MIRWHRKPYRWACPACGGTFATIHVSMDRRRNHLPRIRSMWGRHRL